MGEYDPDQVLRSARRMSRVAFILAVLALILAFAPLLAGDSRCE